MSSVIPEVTYIRCWQSTTPPPEVHVDEKYCVKKLLQSFSAPCSYIHASETPRSLDSGREMGNQGAQAMSTLPNIGKNAFQGRGRELLGTKTSPPGFYSTHVNMAQQTSRRKSKRLSSAKRESHIRMTSGNRNSWDSSSVSQRKAKNWGLMFCSCCWTDMRRNQHFSSSLLQARGTLVSCLPGLHFIELTFCWSDMDQKKKKKKSSLYFIVTHLRFKGS